MDVTKVHASLRIYIGRLGMHAEFRRGNLLENFTSEAVKDMVGYHYDEWSNVFIATEKQSNQIMLIIYFIIVFYLF
jgi:hypothetical protein